VDVIHNVRAVIQFALRLQFEKLPNSQCIYSLVAVILVLVIFDSLTTQSVRYIVYQQWSIGSCICCLMLTYHM